MKKTKQPPKQFRLLTDKKTGRRRLITVPTKTWLDYPRDFVEQVWKTARERRDLKLKDIATMYGVTEKQVHNFIFHDPNRVLRQIKSTYDKGHAPVLCHCAYEECGVEFSVDWCSYKSRTRQMERNAAKNGGRAQLFCSRACAVAQRRLEGSVLGHQLKRRPGMSDEQFYWDTLLSRMGLGMDRGTPGWLLYGEDENVGEGPRGRAAGRYGT